MKASRIFRDAFFDYQRITRNNTKMKRGIVEILLHIRKNEATFVLDTE